MELYLNQAFARDRILEELRNQDSAFYLLYRDSRPAGCLKLNEAAAQTETGDPHSLEVERIYVAKRISGNRAWQSSDGRGGEAGGRAEEGVYLAWRLGEK